MENMITNLMCDVSIIVQIVKTVGRIVERNSIGNTVIIGTVKAKQIESSLSSYMSSISIPHTTNIAYGDILKLNNEIEGFLCLPITEDIPLISLNKDMVMSEMNIILNQTISNIAEKINMSPYDLMTNVFTTLVCHMNDTVTDKEK